MLFKHPEILYFLFLLIVPILVHLFQFRRFKKEYFTNVQFLSALSEQTRKSASIKKWLLLSCRLLLLSFIILAFAQPYFEAKDKENNRNEICIILDNSFSMQAKGKKGELLRRAVQELLEDIPENTIFSLLTNSENFWDTDIKSIRSSLQNLQYSSLPFQLDPILVRIRNHKPAFKKDLIIITDALGLDRKQLKKIDKDDIPYFVIPKAEQKNNTAIDSVYINDISDDFYEITVALSHYGNDSKEVPIAVYNQDKLIAKTAVTFETQKKSINFTISKKPFHGFVSVSDAGLSYDNILYFTISNIKKINIIAVGEVIKSNFLSRIYTNSEFNFINSPIDLLDYNSIEKQDVIILNELDAIPQALHTTLSSFVEKGGNLIVIPSEKNSAANLNEFLNSFGVIEFRSFQRVEKLIAKINFSHPLFKDVFKNRITNFQYPKTNGSFSLSNANSAALYNDDQSTFLTGLPNALSTVYIFSAPINTVNSNFQQSPLIVPTFYKMAMNNQSKGINALPIGNTNPYLVDINLSRDAVLTVTNTAESFIPTQRIINNKVKLTFNDYPEQAGNYGIYNQKEFVENISFNYERGESNVDSKDRNVLSDYKIVDSIANVFDTIQTTRLDNQLWKWFVIFALLFLVSEMAIMRFLK
jgi:hypothetical protein